MITLLRLFWEFFKTGLFAVGGGLATLPFLSDIADKTGWFTHAQLADMIAVSESTPGPIGVNMATYVGFTAGGIPGAVIATLGLITPSIVIILVIAYFLKKFRDSRLVNDTLYGLRPASVALISAAGVDIVLYALFRIGSVYEIASAVISWKSLVLFGLIFVLTRYVPKLKKLHPIWFIALSAVIGVVLQMSV